MGENIGIVSLGCDKNRIDAEVMLHNLAEDGYSLVGDASEADIIIINTCGFIEISKQQSIDMIVEMSKNKNNGRCKSIIVTGCLAERYREELLEKLPEIDAIVGVGGYREISKIVKDTLNGRNNIVKVPGLNYDMKYEERMITTPSHYAFVKIAEGCSNYCTYCIIPKLRGKYRSKKIEDILRECKEIAGMGVKELILVAQDTTRYGTDMYGKKMLAALLREIEKLEGIEWVRIMYSYPEEVDDEIIEIIKNSKKICRYFDIPIQHISNKVLKSMGRHSSKEKIISLVEKIRKDIPEAVIRTSIIVGFPGETDEDYNELRDFLVTYKLDRVGFFAYSKEEGTSAALMDSQIPEEVKQSRKDALTLMQKEVSLEKNIVSVGKSYDVVIEGRLENGSYYGRSQYDAPEIDQRVFVKANEESIEIGEIKKVKITKAHNYDLEGEFLD